MCNDFALGIDDLDRGPWAQLDKNIFPAIFKSSIDHFNVYNDATSIFLKQIKMPAGLN